MTSINVTGSRAGKKIERRPGISVTNPELSGFSPLLQKIYAGRGVRSANELNHSLAHLAAPSTLLGLDKAAKILADAVATSKSIVIVGDFDADGATSCALMVLALRAMGGANVNYLVPDRFRYGYGLTPEIVATAAQFKPDVLVTVDNGISSIEGAAYAQGQGIALVITDHHLPGASLPVAAAIVNPNQAGCAFPSKALAGVGVAFYVLSAVRAVLRDMHWFDSKGSSGKGKTEPKLADYLDLVALGTVADVVPMDQNNRILVEEGIKRIRRGSCRPGIRALLEAGGTELRHVTSRDLAFTVAPRLNAAGRLQDMSIGVECLMVDATRAGELAGQLESLNTERKEIEVEMREQAEAHIAPLNLESGDDVGLCLFDESWHQGVVGILASRIKEKTHRPVIAFARAAPDELKGSARSISGFHVRDALDAIAARNPGLLLKFGGHAMAAGLSLVPENLDLFRREFNHQAKLTLDAQQLDNILLTDGEIDADIDLATAKEIEMAAPWGQGFAEPMFDGRFGVLEQRIVGGRHLKMLLRAPNGNPIEAICFNQHGLVETHEIRCAYRLDINRFRGRETPQLIVEAIVG